MYVTRSLSQLLKSPGSRNEKPDGPNSGFLVIQDDKSETHSCFGRCQDANRLVCQLPFPQNKELTVRYVVRGNYMDSVFENLVYFIPALNTPLSYNRYYAIDAASREHKGEAFTCSTEDDKVTRCFFCRCIKEVKPRPLDPRNIYQQFQILPAAPEYHRLGKFMASTIAQDGFPPEFLRRRHWSIEARTVPNIKLDVAQGLDSKLRACLPQFDHLCLSQKSSQPLIVGKWYCPFMFVKEGTLKAQVKRSMYYEMTLEQRWEQIFTYQKNRYNDPENSVAIDALVEKEEVFLNGMKASWSEKNVVDGVIWFTSVTDSQRSVGLRLEVFQRMRWEQARGGWVGGDERQVKIDRIEEFKGDGKWCAFGCYILVERFNLKRMDGSLVMSYDFKHCNQMKTKWVLCQCFPNN